MFFSDKILILLGICGVLFVVDVKRIEKLNYIVCNFVIVLLKLGILVFIVLKMNEKFKYKIM